MSAELDNLTDFYVQQVLYCAQDYLGRDELLLRKVVRSLLEQYAVCRREATEDEHRDK